MKDYSAETGAALADEDQPIKAFAHAVVTPATRTPSPGTFATIALDRITPSLTNPRKTFDPAKLQDLAESIRSSGVHQPILVRPLPGSRVGETDRTVQHQVGPEAWDVLFTAKVAKPVTGKAVAAFQSFHATELEVVE